MPLRALGFCGVDDSVDPTLLQAVSAMYPLIEWGVLLRPDKEGEPRYPSPEWMDRLAAHPLPHLAGHLCGERCNEVLRGDYAYVKAISASHGFKRFQVNATAVNGVDTSDLAGAASRLRECMVAVREVEWILQRNEETAPLVDAFIADPEPNMALLYDASCGTGVLATEYEAPIPGVRCGYAGGIAPSNVISVLSNVRDAAGDVGVWIDMESSLRAVSRSEGRDIFSITTCADVAAKVMSSIG